MKAEENCGILQKTADLVTFTEEILNGKLFFVQWWHGKELITDFWRL